MPVRQQPQTRVLMLIELDVTPIVQDPANMVVIPFRFLQLPQRTVNSVRNDLYRLPRNHSPERLPIKGEAAIGGGHQGDSAAVDSQLDL